MGKVWEGKSYNEDWVPVDGMGNATGDKDWAANAAYAAATQTQNPYTNEAGASEYDKSGLIPGNEPGSTLPKGPAPVLGARRISAAAPAQIIGGGSMNTIQPWAVDLFNPSTPMSAPLKSRTSAPAAATQGFREDGPRRISSSASDPNTPFLLDQGQPSEDDALAELAKILQGVLR